jgi:FKBP-type peptidyl-prolyl cis-trans isomerase
MKTHLLFVAVALALTPLALAAETELKDQKDRISYGIGLDIGTTLKRQKIDVDEQILNAGVQDGLSGEKPRLTESQAKEVMSKAQEEMSNNLVATRKAAERKNAVEGPKFLAENKTKEGVKTTASGLQYKVLSEGFGPTPKETDTVEVNFTGKSIDGQEFESTYRTGHPEELPVNRMIKGWREGFQLMKVGSKFQLFVPADLAYGKNSAGPVAPNATLIFEMELLDIVPPGKVGSSLAAPAPKAQTLPKER